jgi:vacuolar-type H+-ATPase subunit C/Vma6
MADALIGLVSRAKGLSTRLLSRQTLEGLADADDLDALARHLSRVAPQLESLVQPIDVFAIERAIGQTAHQHLRTLERWREQTGGVLDIHAARQDRLSLRALLRGAAEGAPPSARLRGLLSTESLPQPVLARLAQASSPADVVRELALLAHPDVPRLLPLVKASQTNLLAVDVALLAGLAERATHAAARADRQARDFVHALIDVGNVQNALLLAAGSSGPYRLREYQSPRASDTDVPAARTERPELIHEGHTRSDVIPADVFVRGGRWLAESAFVAAAAADRREHALTVLAAALAASPLASALPAVASDVAALDRAFLVETLRHLTRAARLEPLSTAPLLRVLLLIEAQSRDLRELAWGAEMRTPPALRKQQLVTPS